MRIAHKKTTRAVLWIARVVVASPKIPEGVRGGGTAWLRDRRATLDGTQP